MLKKTRNPPLKPSKSLDKRAKTRAARRSALGERRSAAKSAKVDQNKSLLAVAEEILDLYDDGKVRLEPVPACGTDSGAALCAMCRLRNAIYEVQDMMRGPL